MVVAGCRKRLLAEMILRTHVVILSPEVDKKRRTIHGGTLKFSRRMYTLVIGGSIRIGLCDINVCLQFAN